MANELAHAIVEAAKRMQQEEKEDTAVAAVLYTNGTSSGLLYFENYSNDKQRHFYDYFRAIQSAKQQGLVPMEDAVAEMMIQKANEIHRKAGIARHILGVFIREK
jgi:CRISPR/Cas system CSM-associated protein Csm2 small subunit